MHLQNSSTKGKEKLISHRNFASFGIACGFFLFTKYSPMLKDDDHHEDVVDDGNTQIKIKEENNLNLLLYLVQHKKIRGK